MEAPSNAPPAKIFAPTMKPIAIGAIVPKLPFFGSTAVAYTVYTSPNVITISNTSALPTPTPADNANAEVSYKIYTYTYIYIYSVHQKHKPLDLTYIYIICMYYKTHQSTGGELKKQACND